MIRRLDQLAIEVSKHEHKLRIQRQHYLAMRDRLESMERRIEAMDARLYMCEHERKQEQNV